MNIVLIVPTGIGAEIGGHAGDANPVCKLLAGVADRVITHPNVVNASDINEMPDNVWYVDGLMLDQFLTGGILLKQPLQNKILVVANPPLLHDTINAVAAARVTIGIDATVLELDEPLKMTARFVNKEATGDVSGWESLVEQVKDLPYDALAIHTPVQADRAVVLGYLKSGGVNPWGGVEARASRLIGRALGKPVAHAPQETISRDDEEMWGALYRPTDPRIAPEIISSCYLHSVLKGLNRAPRPQILPWTGEGRRGLHANSIDAMISPAGCWGTPHAACLGRRIPIISVRENSTIYGDEHHPDAIGVDNYWEAAGVLMCMRAGIAPSSVRRPLID